MNSLAFNSPPPPLPLLTGNLITPNSSVSAGLVLAQGRVRTRSFCAICSQAQKLRAINMLPPTSPQNTPVNNGPSDISVFYKC